MGRCRFSRVVVNFKFKVSVFLLVVQIFLYYVVCNVLKLISPDTWYNMLFYRRLVIYVGSFFNTGFYNNLSPVHYPRTKKDIIAPRDNTSVKLVLRFSKLIRYFFPGLSI